MAITGKRKRSRPGSDGRRQSAPSPLGGRDGDVAEEDGDSERQSWPESPGLTITPTRPHVRPRFAPLSSPLSSPEDLPEIEAGHPTETPVQQQSGLTAIMGRIGGGHRVDLEVASERQAAEGNKCLLEGIIVAFDLSLFDLQVARALVTVLDLHGARVSSIEDIGKQPINVRPAGREGTPVVLVPSTEHRRSNLTADEIARLHRLLDRYGPSDSHMPTRHLQPLTTLSPRLRSSGWLLDLSRADPDPVDRWLPPLPALSSPPGEAINQESIRLRPDESRIDFFVRMGQLWNWTNGTFRGFVDHLMALGARSDCKRVRQYAGKGVESYLRRHRDEFSRRVPDSDRRRNNPRSQVERLGLPPQVPTVTGDKPGTLAEDPVDLAVRKTLWADTESPHGFGLVVSPDPGAWLVSHDSIDAPRLVAVAGHELEPDVRPTFPGRSRDTPSLSPDPKIGEEKGGSEQADTGLPDAALDPASDPEGEAVPVSRPTELPVAGSVLDDDLEVSNPYTALVRPPTASSPRPLPPAPRCITPSSALGDPDPGNAPSPFRTPVPPSTCTPCDDTYRRHTRVIAETEMERVLDSCGRDAWDALLEMSELGEVHGSITILTPLPQVRGEILMVISAGPLEQEHLSESEPGREMSGGNGDMGPGPARRQRSRLFVVYLVRQIRKVLSPKARSIVQQLLASLRHVGTCRNVWVLTTPNDPAFHKVRAALRANEDPRSVCISNGADLVSIADSFA